MRVDWWDSQHAEEMLERVRAEQEAMRVQRQQRQQEASEQKQEAAVQRQGTVS